VKTPLSLDKLSVSYGQLEAVENLSFEVADNTITSLIGPNGCGKSTAVKAIAGITAYSGKISASKKIAYLPQQDSLMPWLSVTGNILLPAKLKDLNLGAAAKRSEKYLHDFGLARFSDYYPHQLSGGMRQKVALIRTVLYQPDLVLIDEPFSALDAITRLHMQDWLLQLKQREKFACLLVTHDINEAIALSDTIIALSQRPAKIVEEFKITRALRSDPHKKFQLENNLKRILLNEKI